MIRGFSLTPLKQAEAKAAIINRLSIFRRTLTASADDAQLIGMELARLLGAFPTQDLGASAALRIDAYKEAIGDTPPWALREARLRILRGQVGSPHRFAPSPPELVQIIDEVFSVYRRDLADLVTLAEATFDDAPVLPPPEPPGRVSYEDAQSRPITGRFDTPSPARRAPEADRAAAEAALKARMDKLGVDKAALADIAAQPPRVELEQVAEGLGSYIARED